MLLEHDWPRAHLVMDDFFGKAALGAIFREIATLAPKMKPGLVRDIGHDGQSVFFEHERRRNRAVWIHEPSKTLRLFRERLWSPAMVGAFERAREPLFQIIPNCSAPHLQVSSYRTGDHYDFHEDEGAGVNLTSIVFLAAAPKKVHGGDLVLSYDGEETTIPFRHNRLVVFPSKTLHAVTPVRIDGDDPEHARISLQCWLTFGRTETRGERRGAEADQPTFLLAEEGILAAAQALSASAPEDQAPEDLYWGAFYLARILSANLRTIARDQDGLELGDVRVRRSGELEVHARARLAGAQLRVGFVLRGPETPPAEALSLFVETGRGSARRTKRKAVPAGAGEKETSALLRRLLSRSGRASGAARR